MIYRTGIGLDVRARSISAAAFVPETGEVEERSFGYDAEAVAKWAAGLPQPARAVYESGPIAPALFSRPARRNPRFHPRQLPKSPNNRNNN